MAAPRPRSNFGNEQIDNLLTELLEAKGSAKNDIVRSMLVTVLDMDEAEVDTLNLKIASQALAEMLNSWKVFSPFNDRAKVTIFGSARTKPEHPDYKLAVEFGNLIMQRDWMAITGAGPGIMSAGIEGITVPNAFGVSIVLPFEKNAVPIIDGNEKLATYKYFFTRKLTFMKETDAFALFPGGYGTLDEAFELLTLIQTGKSYPAPIVLLDHPDSTYWKKWDEFVRSELFGGGQISEPDLDMYFHTHDPAEAVEYVCSFYSSYHSVRTVNDKVIIRLNRELDDESIQILSNEFSEIITDGELEKCGPTKAEIRDEDHIRLDRLQMKFDNRSFAKLLKMISRINELGGVKGAKAIENLVHDLSSEED